MAYRGLASGQSVAKIPDSGDDLVDTIGEIGEQRVMVDAILDDGKVGRQRYGYVHVFFNC